MCVLQLAQSVISMTDMRARHNDFIAAWASVFTVVALIPSVYASECK